MKIGRSRVKKMIHKKYNLAGNCVYGLDDPYFRRNVCSDATEMAGIVDEYANDFLSSDDFIKNVNWSYDLMGLPADNIYDFAYNPSKDIYWAYNIDDDVHFFFVKDSINENYRDTISVKSIKLVDLLEDILPEPEHKGKYVYIGTCMNSFDEYGECLHDTFYDEEHFFNSWQNAVEISKDEFWSKIDPSSEMYDEVKELEADPEYPAEYRYSEEDDIYYIFVSDDTHYFFVSPDSYENIKDNDEEDFNESQLKTIQERLEFGSKERIHVSTKPISELGITQQSSGSLKPKGLWYGFGDQWINWLKSEMPEWWDEAQYAYKVFPNLANILVINTIEELDQFIDTYNIGRNIDWVRVAEEYDGIEFPSYSREGFRNLAFSSSDHMKYMWVYSMDISSGCIWNPNGIKSLKAFGKKR